MDNSLPFRVDIPTTINILTVVTGHHAPDGRMVEVNVEVRGDLPAILDVEQWQGDIKRFYLEEQ